MSCFIESSERISAAHILSQLRFQPSSDAPADSTIECANILLATRESTFPLHFLVRKDFLHHTVVFKRPHVALGSAFQPAAKSGGPGRLDDDFGLAGPVTQSLKSKGPLPYSNMSCLKRKSSSLSHDPFVASKEEYALDVARDLTSFPELPLESESSLLSPPLSPQVEDDFVQEIPKEKVFVSAAKRLRRDSGLSTSVIQQASRKEEAKKHVKPMQIAGRMRQCISCHITQTPCWRPSWDPIIGQLCNSCGLRYRKTQIRCSSPQCANVPSKLDLAAIRTQCRGSHLQCPNCDSLLIKD